MFYVETKLNEFAEIMRLGGDVCVVDKNSNKNITVYANVKTMKKLFYLMMICTLSTNRMLL